MLFPDEIPAFGRALASRNQSGDWAGGRGDEMYRWSVRLDTLNPSRAAGIVLEWIAEHPINRNDELLPWSVASALAGRTQLAA